MNEFIVQGKKKLRLGYTTGSCAAAASKAAAFMLLSKREKPRIQLTTPKGIKLDLEVLEISINRDSVSCAIIKDGGDDPDITKGSLVFAKVSLIESPEFLITGGKGVGKVTKPGLDQPVGEFAINSVPRKMIRENLLEVCKLFDYHKGFSVVISVPDGEKLSSKTFNPRLGIVGGISILGTTGIVEPMSEKALVDTIKIELNQKKARGDNYVLLAPGNYGSDFIKEGLNIDSSLAVLTSNFIGDALDICNELGFKGAVLVGHVGKLVKIAGGMLNTHSKYGDCRMEIMASYGGKAGLPSEGISRILDCATCDDAIGILKENDILDETLRLITERIHFIMDYRLEGKMEIGALLFSKKYGFLSQTDNTAALLNLITEE